LAEQEDHGPVATHPVILGIAGVAFLVLMVLGFQLKAASGHHGVAQTSGHHQTDAQH